MKNLDAVIDALDVLWNNVETKFERHRVRNLILDLLKGPPKVEVIDDTHQKFNGVTYKKNKTGHYSKMIFIHQALWTYYNDEIPEGYVIHHIDDNPENNDIENLSLMTRGEHSFLHNQDKIFKKTCPICGKNFETPVIGIIYCSDECAFNAKHPVKHCAFCGKEFQTTIERKDKLFCSLECKIKARQQKIFNSRLGKVETCRHCGKTFPAVERIKGGFCSKLCQGRFQRKNNLEERICLHCGKPFKTYKYGKIKFCSTRCANIFNNPKEIKTITAVCSICGKSFETTEYKPKKTCSPECANKLKSRTLKDTFTQKARKNNSGHIPA